MVKLINLFAFNRYRTITILLTFMLALSACQPAVPQPIDDSEEIQLENTAASDLPTESPAPTPTEEQPQQTGEFEFIQLTDEEFTQYHPQWSPDGRTLGFVANQDGKSEIWLRDEGDEKARLFYLDLNGDFAFHWSSDGSHMIFDAYDSQEIFAIWWMEYPGGTPIQVSPEGSGYTQPDFSPDGRQVICQTGGDLFILQLETGEITVFEESASIEWLPQWSPDGAMMLFTSIRSGNADLWIKPLDGGEAIQLTSDQAYDDRGVWSPDGRFIAFVSDRKGNEDIWLYELSTGNLTQVTTHEAVDSMPAWHPDGQRLVFASERSGNMDIWSVDVSVVVSD